MQRSEAGQVAKSTHRRVQTSATSSRRNMKRPSGARPLRTIDIAVSTKNTQASRKITRFATPVAKQMPTTAITRQPAQVKAHPTQIIANQRLRERQQPVKQVARPTAKELKDQAIQRALATTIRQSNAEEKAVSTTKPKRKLHFGPGRVVLALSCAVAAVFAIIYFVNLNMPDIQFRATAAQLNANYPNYVPYNYGPVEISSENQITSILFKNKSSGESFTIIEEESSWDSNALLNNYVKEMFGEDYTIVREQGLTIYISNHGSAAWVNGGTVYKLNASKGALTKKQISSIATSF